MHRKTGAKLERRSRSLPEVAGGARGDGSWVFRAVPASLVGLAVLVFTMVLVAALVPIERVVEGTGVLEPLSIETVRAPEGGVVSKVLFGAGDTVVVGQLLVQLDPAEHDAELATVAIRLQSQRLRYQQARREETLGVQEVANLHARAAAAVVRARAELRSSLTAFQIDAPVDSFLVAYRSGEHVQFDQAVAALRQAEIGLAEAEAANARARLLTLATAREGSAVQVIEAEKRALEKKRGAVDISSPINGVVLGPWRTESLVRKVLAKGDPIVEIGEEGGWRVMTEIRATDVHRISVGMTAKVRVESLPASSRPTFEGIVSRIAPTSALLADGGGRRAYQVEVAIPFDVGEASTAPRLRYGYLARVQFVTASEPILMLLWDRLTESVAR